MNTIHVSSDRFVCELCAEAQPLLEVPPGSTLTVQCQSALDFAVWFDKVNCSPHPERSRRVGPCPPRAQAANPATGPIAVTGALPGQALKVTVLDIAPEAVGHISAGPTGGHRRLEIQEGEVVFDESIRIPTAPMIGVLGVVPAEGSWTTMECGPFGGNLDTNDVAPGATVYLPVFRPGGLFVVGDVHAVMGDGEIGGQGLEVAAEVTLRVDVEPHPLSPSIYLYRDDELMTIGTAESLDEACDVAARAMAAVIARTGVMDEFSAMKFLGLAGELRVGQNCCSVKSARVALPLRYLPTLRPEATS